MFTVVTGTGLVAAELARLALKQRLYVSGWELSYELRRIIKRKGTEDYISLVMVDNQPIALAVSPNPKFDDGIPLQCFTRKALRRKGYGSLAVKNLRGALPETRRIRGNWSGTKAGVAFFKRHMLL